MNLCFDFVNIISYIMKIDFQSLEATNIFSKYSHINLIQYQAKLYVLAILSYATQFANDSDLQQLKKNWNNFLKNQLKK